MCRPREVITFLPGPAYLTVSSQLEIVCPQDLSCSFCSAFFMFYDSIFGGGRSRHDFWVYLSDFHITFCSALWYPVFFIYW